MFDEQKCLVYVGLKLDCKEYSFNIIVDIVFQDGIYVINVSFMKINYNNVIYFLLIDFFVK